MAYLEETATVTSLRAAAVSLQGRADLVKRLKSGTTIGFTVEEVENMAAVLNNVARSTESLVGLVNDQFERLRLLNVAL